MGILNTLSYKNIYVVRNSNETFFLVAEMDLVAAPSSLSEVSTINVYIFYSENVRNNIIHNNWTCNCYT